MKLSTRVRYAARAMIELTLGPKNKPLQLSEIAGKQGISVKYLEQVMSPLRARGYVRTRKGSGGGYLLAVPPEDITLYDIVESIEGSMAPVYCVEDEEACDRTDICATRPVWLRLKEAIRQELAAKSLAELAEEQQALNNKS